VVAHLDRLSLQPGLDDLGEDVVATEVEDSGPVHSGADLDVEHGRDANGFPAGGAELE
jgi:hypothetical protein